MIARVSFEIDHDGLTEVYYHIETWVGDYLEETVRVHNGLISKSITNKWKESSKEIVYKLVEDGMEPVETETSAEHKQHVEDIYANIK